jgi:hypothetical protein
VRVVGTYEDPWESRYLWTKKKRLCRSEQHATSGSGLVLTMAVSINDRGQILAIGMAHPDISPDRRMDQDEEDDLHSVDVHSFLLTPIEH